MNHLKFSRQQADLIIRHHIDEYISEHGNNDRDILDQFTRQLAVIVEANLDSDYMWDAADAYEKIGAALDGTLEECEVSRDGTMDNREELADRYSQDLCASINMIMDSANFAGSWVTR